MKMMKQFQWLCAVSSLLTVVSQSQWILQSTPNMPKSNFAMGIGYYNNSIYLIGGWSSTKGLVSYNTDQNTFTDYNNVLSYDTYGLAQFYCQLQDTVYMIDRTYRRLSTYDLQNKVFNPRWNNIPSHTIAAESCLAGIDGYLFVLGGTSNIDASNQLLMLNISNNTWNTDLPSMQTPRVGLSCIIHPDVNMLYAIGGADSNDFQNQNSIRTVEMIAISSIKHHSWRFLFDNLIIATENSRSVIYGNNIFVTGGENGGWSIDTMQIIHVINNTISLGATMAYKWSSAATIFANDILYVFGGYNTGIKWQYYPFLDSTADPSNDPTAFPTTSNSTTSNPTTLNPTTFRPTTSNPSTTIPTSSLNPTTLNPATLNPIIPSATTLASTNAVINTTVITPISSNASTTAMQYIIWIVSVVMCVFLLVFMGYYVRKRMKNANQNENYLEMNIVKGENAELDNQTNATNIDIEP
eukprot:483867_1